MYQTIGTGSPDIFKKLLEDVTPKINTTPGYFYTTEMFYNPIKYSLFEEKDGLFVQTINLPGVSKEQVNVKVKENDFIVTIKEDTLNYKKDESFIYHLPKYGKFKELKAVMKDGVLTIIVPKKNVEYNVKVD